MNNSQHEASLTGNIRKRDDAEPNLSIDEGEVNNTNELRRKRYTLSRNDRVEDDDYNYLFSSSSSNNNNNNELSTSTSSTLCVLPSPLSNRINNTTNAYASLVSIFYYCNGIIVIIIILILIYLHIVLFIFIFQT